MTANMQLRTKRDLIDRVYSTTTGNSIGSQYGVRSNATACRTGPCGSNFAGSKVWQMCQLSDFLIDGECFLDINDSLPSQLFSLWLVSASIYVTLLSTIESEQSYLLSKSTLLPRWIRYNSVSWKKDRLAFSKSSYLFKEFPISADDLGKRKRNVQGLSH